MPLFNKKKNVVKQKYTADKIDWIEFGYWLVFLSFVAYFVARVYLPSEIAFSFLIAFPSIIGIIFFLLLIPYRLFVGIISHLIVYFHTLRMPKNTLSDTVIVLGKNNYKNLSYWFAPNYGVEFILLLRYLKLTNVNFSIFKNATPSSVDKIMSSPSVKTVYFVGHGRRHGFVLDNSTVLDYCRYNDAKYSKDFVFQIHCNQNKGISLVEYVVPEKNQSICMPENGYMSNITIGKMFIDKITRLKNRSFLNTILTKGWLWFLSMILPISTLVIWGYFFFSFF